ncbi:MAG: aldo/keto reductase [Planctomyces sp.]|jgi:aryl-alcohol dehydrogenase-like predicted oxidoreductase|nr:aldo/keto reductase [Planctomyces sp.]
MIQRRLGRTGLLVSEISFGAGPVSGLMTGTDTQQQLEVLRAAIHSGINWVDTAAGYGNGTSEKAVGAALRQLDPQQQIQVATKVRIHRSSGASIRQQITAGITASLSRLQRSHITLLQLHNAITEQPDQEPFSLTPEEVLGPQGVAAAFNELRQSGIITCCGLTGTGQPAALRKVLESEQFETLQIPFNRLNPSAGMPTAPDTVPTDYGNLLADCQRLDIGAFAIRVLAGGAVAGNPPSAHTLTTPFFPLDLYQHDLQKAQSLAAAEPASHAVTEAIRFVLQHPAVCSAIIGFAQPHEVLQACTAAC